MSFFGQNIRFLRNRAQLSQTAFAEIFNLKRAAVGAYEEERAEPKVEVFVMIARHFGIPVEDLICANLQEKSLNNGTGAVMHGICYVSAAQHWKLAGGYSWRDISEQRLSLPGIDNPEGLIAVEYGDSTLIVREMEEPPSPDGHGCKDVLAAMENGVRLLPGAPDAGCRRAYRILYIIKRYQGQDFAELMLGDIAQRLERLERRS